jgi:hypothetical protein
MGNESRDIYGFECSVYGMCELFDQNKKNGGGFFVGDVVFPFSNIVGGFHSADRREPYSNFFKLSCY